MRPFIDMERIVAAAGAVMFAAVLVAGCAVSPRAQPGRSEGDGTTMKVTSTAYADGATMDAMFATRQVAGGHNVSVPLEWSGAPAGTRSFVIAMIDTHPVARGWVHWLVVDVPAGTSELPEGASGASMPPGSLELAGTSGTSGYSGPQPPPGSGVHDYVTTVYALDVPDLGLSPGARWPDVQSAMGGHVLASASVTGRFGR